MERADDGRALTVSDLGVQGYSSLAVRDGSLACQKTNPKSGSPERQLEAGATAESPTM